MIQFRHKGNLKKSMVRLVKLKKPIPAYIFEKYGAQGVQALAAATPKDTGRTANSWKYEIVRSSDMVKIAFHNENIQNGVPIAIILQYGHGTRNGGWIQGRDYINPAIQPIFDKLANETWAEVMK